MVFWPKVAVMLAGWFKFFREMTQHAVWSLPPGQFKVWVLCLILANIRRGEWWDGMDRVEIHAGSFITSQDHIAKLARVGRQVVRDALKNLERIGSIRTQTKTKRWTLIQVVNWPTYQGTDGTENQDGNHPGTHGKPTGNHNGRSKKEEVTNIPSADRAAAGEKVTRNARQVGDPNVTVLVNFWADTFEKRFHSRPPIAWGKDGNRAKALLQGRSLHEAKWLVVEHIQRPPQMYEDKGWYGLEHVVNAAPTLLARRAKRETP